MNCFCDYLKTISYDQIIFLGDAVGYGAKPGYCVDIIDKISQVKLLGNHDAAIIGDLELDCFNQAAKKALQWTNQNISLSHKKIIKQWCYSSTQRCNDLNIGLAHASFNSPRSWTYILSPNDALMELKLTKPQSIFIVLVAHSHIPGFFQFDPGSEKIDQYIQGNFQLKLEKKYHYIINPGSIGQPRDRDPRLSFALLDLDEQFVKIIRMEYDFIKTEQEILEAGLPQVLAYRLEKGI